MLSPFYSLYVLIPFNFGLLWAFYFSNNLINLVFISLLVPKWYLKMENPRLTPGHFYYFLLLERALPATLLVAFVVALLLS